MLKTSVKISEQKMNTHAYTGTDRSVLALSPTPMSPRTDVPTDRPINVRARLGLGLVRIGKGYVRGRVS